jgi:hypothetical protein
MPLMPEAIHPFGGLANTGSVLNICVYLYSSAVDCFFQDNDFFPGAVKVHCANNGAWIGAMDFVQARLPQTGSA